MLAERDGLALELAGEPAEVAQDVGGVLGLGARLGADGVAGLLGDDARQLLDAGLHRVGDPLQDAPALARRHLAPGREGRRGGLDGAVDVLGAAAGHAGYGAPRAGGLDGDAAAGRGIHPGAVDQHLRALDARLGLRRPHPRCSLPLP